MKPLTLLLLALMLSGSGLSAQEEGVPVRPFARVRVHAPEVAATPLIGHAVLVDADSLVLDQGRTMDRLVIPIEAVRRLEMSRRSRFMGAVKGAGIGGLVGGVALVGLYATQEGLDEWTFPLLLLGGMYGAPVGAAVGAVVGVERWEAHPRWRVGLRAPL